MRRSDRFFIQKRADIKNMTAPENFDTMIYRTLEQAIEPKRRFESKKAMVTALRFSLATAACLALLTAMIFLFPNIKGKYQASTDPSPKQVIFTPSAGNATASPQSIASIEPTADQTESVSETPANTINAEHTPDPILNGGEFNYASKNSISGSNMMQYNEWIYYSFNSDIFRMKNDGTEKNKLYSNIEQFYYFNIIDGWIYYGNKSGIYKLAADGSSTVKVAITSTEDLTAMIVINGWIFYTENNRVYKIRTDGDEKSFVSDVDARSFETDGYWLYFIVDRNIFKMKSDGTQLVRLSEQNVFDFFVSDGWVYYKYFDRIWDAFDRMKTDGTSPERISKYGYYTYITLNLTFYYDSYSEPEIFGWTKPGSSEKHNYKNVSGNTSVMGTAGDWVIYSTYVNTDLVYYLLNMKNGTETVLYILNQF